MTSRVDTVELALAYRRCAAAIAPTHGGSQSRVSLRTVSLPVMALRQHAGEATPMSALVG